MDDSGKSSVRLSSFANCQQIIFRDWPSGYLINFIYIVPMFAVYRDLLHFNLG